MIISRGKQKTYLTSMRVLFMCLDEDMRDVLFQSFCRISLLFLSFCTYAAIYFSRIEFALISLFPCYYSLFISLPLHLEVIFYFSLAVLLMVLMRLEISWTVTEKSHVWNQLELGKVGLLLSSSLELSI